MALSINDSHESAMNAVYTAKKRTMAICSSGKCRLTVLFLYFSMQASPLQGCQITHGENWNDTTGAPNVVVVLVDDLRWDEFGAAGHNYIKTPNIDRIALEGAYFKNAFATTPLCSPSRASYLTGQYAHSHGIIDNSDRSSLSHQLRTFPAILQSRGYETAFVGKWHMGNDNTSRPGFSFWSVLKGQGEANDPELNFNGKNIKSQGYVTDILTEFAIEFINRERKGPFLLYLSHKGLHPNLHQDNDGKVTKIGSGGFIPAQRHKGMYEREIFRRRPNAFVPPEDKPALMQNTGGLPPLGKETGTPEEVIRERAEMLMAIDEGLGKILKVLELNGQLNSTLILFAADHGYWYGEHGLNEERRLAYEEALRIPLLVRYPPLIEKRSTFEQMVLNIDVAPTLIEIAGGAPDSLIEGKSLVPLLQGQAPKDWRTSFLIEYYTDTVWPRTVNLGYKAIRTARYKYIQYTDLQGMDELYDLKKDPYELKNVLADSRYRMILRELQRDLSEYLK